MSKLHVGIIFGGISTEYDISLRSAENIFHVIDRDKFIVTMIRVDKNGVWHEDSKSNQMVFSILLKNFILNIIRCLKGKHHDVLQYSFCNFVSRNRYNIFSNIDVVFPIIHGRFGEDGSLQGLLRINKIPFVGSGVLGSAISIDKDIAKRLLRDAGLSVAPFITLNHINDLLSMNFEYCADILGLPLFVKPVSQGSSIGVSKVMNSKDFYQSTSLAFSLDRKVLIESAIVGRELECAVLGNKNPKVSVCAEIILTRNTFYSYRNKYFSDGDVKIVIPARISSEINDEIHSVVLRAFYVLQCYGMARVDVFLTSDYRIIVNEVNTLPGFTATSLYPKLWEASGLSSKDLISILIRLALESYQEDQNIYRFTDWGI